MFHEFDSNGFGCSGIGSVATVEAATGKLPDFWQDKFTYVCRMLETVDNHLWF